jgi:hypothetical protein
MLFDVSFIKKHLRFYQFVTEVDCPERTEKAVDLLTSAMFNFADADDAKLKFPKIFVVPEMKEAVKKKLYSLDSSVANYILK